MSLTAITLQNFKGIRYPVRIALKPITLLFGNNSAGKTTIMQAIHYACEILERNNFNPDRTLYGGDVIDLGGFKNLVYQHNLNLPIVMQFDIDLSTINLPEYSDQYLEINFNEAVKTAWIKLTLKWDRSSKKAVLRAYEVGINGVEIAKIVTSEDDRVHSLQGKLTHPLIRPLFSNDVDLEEKAWAKIAVANLAALPTWGKAFEITEEKLVKILGKESDVYSEYLLSQITIGPGEILKDILRQFRHMGAIRQIPPRNFEPSLSPNEACWANGIRAWNTLCHADQSFLDKINTWMLRLKTGYRLQMRQHVELDINFLKDLLSPGVEKLPIHRRLVLIEEATDLEVRPQDVGIGISQLLPVIVAALDNNKFQQIVAIEQPELLIHPTIQVTLADLFISQIAKTGQVFLLETHSEHLLLRFLQRIRETHQNELPNGVFELQPEQISMIYVEREMEGVKLSQLRIDKNGEFIDPLPKGFFDSKPDLAG